MTDDQLSPAVVLAALDQILEGMPRGALTPMQRSLALSNVRQRVRNLRMHVRQYVDPKGDNE